MRRLLRRPPARIPHSAFRTAHSAAGFTLIELIVAGAMLAIGIVGALGALSTCASAIGLGESKTRAVLLAQEKLAELGLEEELAAETTEGDFGEEYPDYTWALTIEAVEEEDLTDLWRTHVAVNWEYAGRPQTYRVERWFYRPIQTDE